MRGRESLCSALVLAVAVAGCIDPRCPKGYNQKGDTCYRIKDAGPDGAVDADGGTGADVDDDAEVPRGGGDDDAEVPPGAGDAGAMDAGDAPPISCAEECAEHEVCEQVDGEPACVCAGGYDSCESGCVDLATDPMNCGECGYKCESGLACKEGACEQKIRELVLGGDRSCALYDSPDGQYPIKCWGDTASKFFRDGATEALHPRGIVGMPKARGIAWAWAKDESRWQCAALSDRDVVRCWGNCGAACGNAGSAALTDTFFDNNVVGLSRVYVNNAATCASRVVQTIDCWGAASMISSGIDTSSPRSITVGGQGTFTDVSLGGGHGCSVTHDDGVVCWGSNVLGQLGAPTDNNAEAQRGVFVTKESGGELSGVVEVEVGPAVSCAITSGGGLWCWGVNSFGALGSGDVERHSGAIEVELSGVVRVAVGGLHTCAVTQGGAVYCWGMAAVLGLGGASQNQGDLLDGAIFSRPQKLVGLDDAVEIRAGQGHTCVRRRSGHVLCWGFNNRGQLGDGTALTRLDPTPAMDLY